MPPDSPDPGSPAQWLSRARSNLVRATQPKPDDVFWEDICFDSQQAVEKALKALLHRKIPFRYVHHIGELLDTLRAGGVEVPEEVLASAELTEYAVEARYPGPFEAVTKDEAAAAVGIAGTVLKWVESRI